MNQPAPSIETVFENLSETNHKFIADLMSTLAVNQQWNSTEMFGTLIAGLAKNSDRWIAIQKQYQHHHMELWSAMVQGGPAAPPAALVEADVVDRRFKAPEWQQLPYFSYLKQAYLLKSRWMAELVEAADIDERSRHKLRFFTGQIMDAAAPSNFAATNPEALKLASTSDGTSLAHGLENLCADVKKHRITMTDEAAFEVARNIAITPGAVVFENELMQLIQYAPATDTVYQRPLLMVPPFINKFYVLDLQPDNSLARYAVAQGHTVFMVSWRNVSADMGHMTWDDYVSSGVIKAIDVARKICAVRQINTLGFCVGGTLLACALAVLRGQRHSDAASVTLLASMLDFSDTGDLSLFVDEAFVKQREQEFAHGGVMLGRQLALTFSFLRANDLVWYYVVNNYLKGRKPNAFDLLHWNSDSTNLPGTMFAYYIRNMYLENNLRIPGKLTMCGVSVDLSKINAPAYVLASREDHIVPWKTAFQSTQLLDGKTEFVLAASGHVAGVINPASSNKRHYSTNPDLPVDADAWLAGAHQHTGSWWDHWSRWLAKRGGKRVAARKQPGNAQYRSIEPAPGRYVKQACD